MFDALVERAREGDREALEEVVESLQPLLIASIKRYYNNSKEYEDLMQDGNMVIMESIYEYNKTKGVHFLGFIKLRIKYLYLDKHKRRYHESLDQKIGEEDDTMVDLLVSDEMDFLDDLIIREDIVRLNKAMDSLSDRQRQVVEMFYLEKMRVGDIGKKLGLAYRTVINTKASALEKMGRKMKVKR